jgi:outer membrane protein assembly factor BamA
MKTSKTHSCFFNKILIFIFLVVFNLKFSSLLSAIEIKHAEITGSTIELEAKEYVKSVKGDLSEKDIEAIGIKVTNEYHNKGYTTSYVEKLELHQNGILEIHVKESKIAAVSVTGIEGKEKNEIEFLLKPLIGSIYNRNELEKKAETLKRLYNLGSVQIYPVNYKDSSDVFLSIKTNKKSTGDFYGSIGFEPIYGLSPSLGYYRPFTDTALDLYAKAGYREGKFRRAEADLKFFLFPDNDPKGFYIGSNAAMFLEHWESYDRDYRRISLSPALGYRAIYQYLIFDLYANEIISEISDYKTEGKKFRDYDTRITLEVEISDKTNLLSKKDATGLKLAASSGKSDLSEKIYIIYSGELKSSFSPFSRLRVSPGIYSYYTTMKERFFWQYVYDKRLLGFYNDYTASKWKNTAGLDFEFEFVPQFFYAGPFVNTGYFQDEMLKWKSRTGGGLMGTLEFKNSYIGIYYAWDLSKGPSKGGISIIAGGSF